MHRQWNALNMQYFGYPLYLNVREPSNVVLSHYSVLHSSLITIHDTISLMLSVIVLVLSLCGTSIDNTSIIYGYFSTCQQQLSIVICYNMLLLNILI